MRKIIARFNSVCPATGKNIRKGDNIYYDPIARKAYHESYNSEAISTKNYIQAQEDAYWDNLTGGYYSK